jgi:outer membrane autotransporter protein
LFQTERRQIFYDPGRIFDTSSIHTMTKHRFIPRWLPIVLALQAAFFWDNARGADISGTTAVTLTSGETGDVASGASLSVSTDDDAITVEGDGGTVTINNSGTIEQTDEKRTIRDKSDGVTLIINNAAGAEITAVGNDVVKVDEDTVLNLENQGTIHQKGTELDSGQALDLRDMETENNTIVNGSETNSAAAITADNGDAVRPGDNTTVTNYGTIVSNGPVNTKFPDYLVDDDDAPGAEDAIDIDDNTNVTINNYGTISGPRHGITADEEVTVNNYEGGEIIGRNGSGVGSDGTGTVTNYGLISGRYAGAGNVFEQADYIDDEDDLPDPPLHTTVNNGDGDGVDIDGIATIDNYGTIEGTGAGGYDSDGNPNGSDAIAVGGGTINNHAGGLISGLDNGILVDDGAGGTGGYDDSGRGTEDTPGGIVTIINEGTITGTNEAAMNLVGEFDDTIDNSGTINGNVYAGDGSDTMIVRNGAMIATIPVLDGGDPVENSDTLTFIDWTGTLGPSVINWESIELTDGSVVSLPESGSVYTLVFEDLTIDATSTLDASNNAPEYVLENASLPGTVHNDGTISLVDNTDTDDRLTINDDYAGASGVLAMDINTPEGTSDQVTINGSATGSTEIVVNELGDPLPSADPMTLVVVSGSTSPDAFSIDERNRLFGPYVYAHTIGYNDDDASTFMLDVISKGYNDHALLLQSITPFIERLGYESVMKFHERKAYGWFRTDDGEQESWWVRLAGSKYKLGTKSDAATTFKGYTGWFQLGTDLFAAGDSDTRFDFGLFAGAGYNEADVDGAWTDTAGEISQTSYGAGIYLTLHERGTWYLDAVGQAIYNDLSIDDADGDKHSPETWSWIASIETGGCLKLSPSFRIQPEAQLVYQYTDGINLSTVVGDVSVRDHDGLQGRLSLTAIGGACKDQLNPFFEVSLLKDFSDPNEVTYSDGKVTLESNIEEWFLGGAIGLSREVSETNNLGYYIKAGAMYGLDGLDSYSYTLMAGIKAGF